MVLVRDVLNIAKATSAVLIIALATAFGLADLRKVLCRQGIPSVGVEQSSAQYEEYFRISSAYWDLAGLYAYTHCCL